MSFVSSQRKRHFGKITKVPNVYRNSVNTTAALAPLVFGRKLKSRIDLIDTNPSSPSSPPSTNIVNNTQCMQIRENGNEIF